MLILFVCALVCTGASANINDDFSDSASTVFRKCCPRNQSLLKVSVFDVDYSVHYECVDHQTAEKSYNITSPPLLISDSVTINNGMPIECDNLEIIRAVNVELELLSVKTQCYDRLLAEIVNDTVKQNIPQTVGLTCNSNETENITKSPLHISHIRKCCKKGQAYDSEYHECRHVDSAGDESWLIDRLNVSSTFIYDVEVGLECKYEEYAIELNEINFLLSLEGSVLNARSKFDEGKYGGRLMQGEWCLEKDYSSSRMVAKVCTRNCYTFKAFCVRKCCPEGYHYRVHRCGSIISGCTPNNDTRVMYNISKYTDPLKDYDNLLDRIGVRTTLMCPEGRFVLNASEPNDRHRLTPEGLLETPVDLSNDYCFEMFDRRHCPENDVLVAAALCFVKEPEIKDFRVAFVLNSISSVCLALTLVVYCSLPELRNLHGRTLICHVSMMLLAYSCLARVQYDQVRDNRVCKLLGYGIYFGFVAAFAWLNVMCFDIWWTFGSVRSVQPLRKTGSDRRRFLWYSLYAWSIAILLTLTMFLLDRYHVSIRLDANIGNGVCWFGTVQNTQSDWPHYIFFVIPMGLVTCTNFVLWVLTARHCSQVKSEVHRLQAGSVGERVKRRFRIDRAKYILTGKLWVVMGAGWVSELLSTLVMEPQWLWFIVDLFNELQGVFIFLILVAKPKLYYLIRKRLGLEKPESQKNGTSSSARTSSTFLSRTISSDERTNLRTSLSANIKKS